MIDQHASAHAVEDALESGEATKDEVIAFLKARIDDKIAHGKRANYPTRHLYEELTGIHAEGATEMKSAAKKAKPDLKIVPTAKPSAPTPVKAKGPKEFDADEYRKSCEASSLKQLKARLGKVHMEVKREILELVILAKESPTKPSAPAKTESEPLSALEQITAALASDDPAAKDAILKAMLENVSPK